MADEPAIKSPGFKFTLSGFSAMCAWHFLMIFTAVFSLNPGAESGRSVWTQLAIYFGLALSYMLIAALSTRIIKRFFQNGIARWRAANICIAICAVIATLLVVFSSEMPIPAQIAAYLFLAFAGALLIFPWLQLPMNKQDESTSYRNLAFNMGIGALLAIVISYLQSPFIYVTICLLPIVSSVLLILRSNNVGQTDEEQPEGKPRHKTTAREALRTNIHFLVFGFAFGFCQGAFAHGTSIAFVLDGGIPLFGAVFSAFVVIFAPYKYLKTYGIFILQRASMVLFFAGLFLAIFFSMPNPAADGFIKMIGWEAAQAVTFAGFNIFEFGFMVFSFAWAVQLKSDYSVYIGSNRTVLYLGMGLGLALGFAGYLLGQDVIGFYVLAIGFAVVLLTFTTLPFFDEVIPYGRIETMAEARQHEADRIAEKAEGRSTDSLDQSEDEAESPHVARWRMRVSKIADEHDLSEREREVFFYLAKGRNAAYIQQELWISIHTVKTHIANIYRKLGVHSIQEVLDMVDRSAEAQSQEDTPSGKEQDAKV
jgi:DNA-binding CsgD family transcriptional regulator